MQTLRFILFSFITLTIISNAQTIIPPGDVSGTWTLGGSPYEINGEITIPNGLTLTIEPGVLVEFQGHYKFYVQGRLLALGTKQDTIIFTANDVNEGWHGIKLLDISSSNDSTIFEYCIFQHGKANTGSGRLNRSGGAINSNLNKLRISHCLFRNNMTYSTSISESAGGAIAIAGGGDPVIEYCEFRENESVYGAAMVIDGNSTDPLIRNNHFHDNNGHGTINIGGGASPILINNLIKHNHSTVHGIIHFADPGGTAVLINNTIANNTCAGQGGAVFVNNGLAPLFINSIIYGNSPAQVHLLAPSGLDFIHCLIEGGRNGFTGANFSGIYDNCINSNPLFVGSNDFHLQNSSPCIGAAIDSIEIAGVWYYCPVTDIEGNPRPNPQGLLPDIGAYESPLAVSGIKDNLSQIPFTYSLYQNYPNPFNPLTTIIYQIPEIEFVTLIVYDVLGSEILTLVNEEKPIGTYEITWHTVNLPSGVYFYRLQAGTYVETKKMVLMK